MMAPENGRRDRIRNIEPHHLCQRLPVFIPRQAIQLLQSLLDFCFVHCILLGRHYLGQGKWMELEGAVLAPYRPIYIFPLAFHD